MIHRIILLSIVSIDVLILLYQTSIISISSHEADILYGDFSFIQQIELFSFFIFGQNEFSLRLPMILFHIFSIYLLYEISKEYVQNKKNQLWLVLAFILLPGVISSAILVDSAGFIIFGLLLFVYMYKNLKIEYSYFLLIFFSLIDHGFLYLFFSLIFYSLYKKNENLLVLNIVKNVVVLKHRPFLILRPLKLQNYIMMFYFQDRFPFRQMVKLLLLLEIVLLSRMLKASENMI